MKLKAVRADLSVNPAGGVQLDAADHQRQQPEEHAEPAPIGAVDAAEKLEAGEGEAHERDDLDNQGQDVHGRE